MTHCALSWPQRLAIRYHSMFSANAESN